MLTGESSRSRRARTSVIGGSDQSGRRDHDRGDRTGAETYLSQVIDMVRKAQASRSRTQDIANRAALG